MHKLSDVKHISNKTIKLIDDDLDFSSDELISIIDSIFLNEFNHSEKIKILKHIIAYSDYNISDYMTYMSYFALVFAVISIVPGEESTISSAITVFLILFPFACIFKKNRANKKFYILKTIASDMLQELEKQNA